MENVQTLFEMLFPSDQLQAEGFCIDTRKLRLAKIQAVKDFDYRIQGSSLICQNGQINPSKGGDRKSSTYFVTLDVAKHLAMMERSEAGKLLRLYFIECEKTLRKIAPELSEEIRRKIEAYDLFMNSTSLYTMAQAAQLLGTGRTRFMRRLREEGVLKTDNTPYQRYVENGVACIRVVNTRHGAKVVTLLTSKGLEALRLREVV